MTASSGATIARCTQSRSYKRLVKQLEISVATREAWPLGALTLTEQPHSLSFRVSPR